MARIAVPRGLVVPGPAKLAEPESRIVPVWVGVGGGVGMSATIATDVLAEKFRLRQVQLWAGCTVVGQLAGGDIYIQTGPVGNVTTPIIRNDWDPVLDMSQAPRGAIYWEGGCVSWTWDFNKYYSGFPRRFAVSIQNYTVRAWRIVASFKISEG